MDHRPNEAADAYATYRNGVVHFGLNGARSSINRAIAPQYVVIGEGNRSLPHGLWITCHSARAAAEKKLDEQRSIGMTGVIVQVTSIERVTP